MGKYTFRTVEEKWEVIRPFIEEDVNIHVLSARFGIDYKVISSWVRKYKADGMDGLKRRAGRKDYPDSLKLEAVRDVLQNGMSFPEAVVKHGISEEGVLRRWVSLYNGGNNIISSKKGASTMPVKKTSSQKGRKTTLAEKVEIVNYAISRDHDYQGAMKEFGVSYSQVYSWVRKFEAGGSDSLKDRRGRNREEEELTEFELLGLEIKRLKTRNAYLEMEGDLAKKLLELKQRRGR